ncbi:hypothetical protein FRC12_001092 [Ceratobasidium sp. 428]|nr:hypothetical protein FRC12_001092 [Ceratobasidium sp. 428]
MWLWARLQLHAPLVYDAHHSVWPGLRICSPLKYSSTLKKSISRPKHSLNDAKIQRSRSLTNIRATSALNLLPLWHCAAFDEGGIPVPVAPASAHVGPVYESSEAVPRPGMQTAQSFQYPTSTSHPIQTLLTSRQGYPHTPATVVTRLLHSPACHDRPSAKDQLAYTTFVRRLRVITSQLAYIGP